MRFTSILIASALIAGGAGVASAQTAAPGVVAPNAPRLKANGDVAPPPSMRANGGVGATEQPYSGTQTRSGGPSGGQNNQQ